MRPTLPLSIEVQHEMAGGHTDVRRGVDVAAGHEGSGVIGARPDTFISEHPELLNVMIFGLLTGIVVFVLLSNRHKK
jgi:hypothetical protein